ncbi:MAG: primosomal protein N' [Candidatus Doudnabacteria bacterium CG10_big_fil_rev_8_21_14_0_10_41_10]|uniref:Replication restart protein PriA n=1 Tax=Candidatus Doudnabacteria bacterium CG10_big_fil_rev_8_21_14_0_10_41_10 TaxID=1974551 RepID=A0A2H0VD22_9BACT|nr:MAG: primosomal protein N' [Candidatus Doudnabacteria bacterium CG10_big_fil_rev_8_21_14_0_10_41_10]
MIAKIIPATRISFGKNQEFSYSVPKNLQGQIQIGMIVNVPFGKRDELGVVRDLLKSEKTAYPLKPVKSIVWIEQVFTDKLSELSKFISETYLVSLGLVIKAIITKFATRPKMIERFVKVERYNPSFKLSDDQTNALAEILEYKNRSKLFLLHGVTGSGKTEIYIQVIQDLLKQGKQALVMVPEIALTPQTLARFAERFDQNDIVVVHSKISYGQKFLIWQKVFRGEAKILIGPRSSIFAPFKNLGVIVIDEEHDSSYKQFDQNPRYHAREVACKLSEIWDCPLVMGDATPTVETYFASQTLDTNRKPVTKLELSNRIKQELPPVTLVDMRQEAKMGNFSIFSESLVKEIEKELALNHQIILFLNRRGTATSMICKDCGSLSMCKSCAVPLVYHQSNQKLECHHCNKKYNIPIKCAKCQSHKLRFMGTGTERVEKEIQRVFTQARVRRIDRDAITKRLELENLYHDFRSHKFDILVGTQLLAKGWDLSQVGLIGVINADTILQLPDFRSNERTFQLITQVAGRTGRGDFPGKVILQTYNPENFAIQAALKHDYKKFFETEIVHRKEFNYPPFSKLIKLTTKHYNEKIAWAKAEQIAESLKSAEGVEILGPSAAFIPRMRGQYIIYVIIKILAGEKQQLAFQNIKKKLTKLPVEWSIDVDPDSLL